MPLFTRRRLAECGEWGAYIRRRIHQVNGHADGILTEAGPDQIRDGSRLDVPAGFLERATSGCLDEPGAI